MSIILALLMLKLEASWGWLIVRDRSRCLYPEKSRYPLRRKLVGSTACLNSCGEGKITCHTGNRGENLQPIASLYTDYVIPAPDERYTSSYWCYSFVPCCVVCEAQVPLLSVVECKTDVFQNQYWVSSMLHILN